MRTHSPSLKISTPSSHEVTMRRQLSMNMKVSYYQTLILPVPGFWTSQAAGLQEINCCLSHPFYSIFVMTVQTNKDSQHSGFPQVHPTQCISSKLMSPFASNITHDRNLSVSGYLPFPQKVSFICNLVPLIYRYIYFLVLLFFL